MKVLVAIAVALTLAAPAAAESLAPDLAAKLPVRETIYCATDSEWPALLAQHGLPADTRAFTQTTSGTMHLTATTCTALRAPLATSAALAYRTLYHEFIHATLHTTDESVADCVSLFMLRYWLRHFYGASAAQAQTVYAAAWNDHLTLPTPYLGTCRFEARDAVSALNG